MTTPPFAAADPVDDTSPRRRLVLAGGVAAALVFGTGGYVLLAGAGAEDSAVAVVPVQHAQPRYTPSTTASATPAPTDPTTTGTVATSARNPYRAIYVEGTAAAAGSAGSTPTPTPTPTPAPAASTAGTTGTTGTTGTSGTSGTTGTRGSTGISGTTGTRTAPVVPPVVTPPVARTTYALTLLWISGRDRAGNRTFRWNVAGVPTLALVGQQFGRTGELRTLAVHLSSTGRLSAVVQVGSAKPVTVKIGQTVQVR